MSCSLTSLTMKCDLLLNGFSLVAVTALHCCALLISSYACWSLYSEKARAQGVRGGFAVEPGVRPCPRPKAGAAARAGVLWWLGGP